MNNKKNKIYIIFYQLGLNKDVINIIFREKIYLEEEDLNIKNWIINDIIESYLENVKGDTSLLNDKDFFG
tara:strand:- start:389 stop:598 length:210 start_codon:yes stop_codon:yes gene_type:complete